MLDDLKKDRQVGVGAQERLKLALYVAALLVMGGAIVMGSQCQQMSSGDGKPADEKSDEEPAADPGPLLDPAKLTSLVAESGDEPDRWASKALDHLRSFSRRGRFGQVRGQHDVSGLGALDPAEARGGVYEIRGRVTEVAREVWKPPSDPKSERQRLWSVVITDEQGAQAVALRQASESDGGPVDAKPPAVPGAEIAVGDHILARGVYVQLRTGTLGGTALRRPTPVLFATKFRLVFPPENLTPPISELDEALWSEVADRFNRESRKWDDDPVFELVQWARAQGYERCRDRILKGDLGFTAWGRDRFDVWSKEVAADADDPRPITEGSRGKVFKMSGYLGELLQFGWERVPPNRCAVDDFQVMTLMSYHYRDVMFRVISPFSVEQFEGVTGERKEHVRIYGVFIKNWTYDTQHKRKDGTNRAQPITAPLLVVLHAEHIPSPEGTSAIRRLMVWVAAAMVLFGVLFYIVLVRGGRKQTQRMEDHRIALRRRIREKGQGPVLPGKGSSASEGEGEGEGDEGATGGDPPAGGD